MDSDDVMLSLLRVEKNRKVVIESTRFHEARTSGEVELSLETYAGWHHCSYTQGSTAANVSGYDASFFLQSGSVGIETTYGTTRFSTLQCEGVGRSASRPSLSLLPSHPPTTEPTAARPVADPTAAPILAPTRSPTTSPPEMPTAGPTAP